MNPFCCGNDLGTFQFLPKWDKICCILILAIGHQVGCMEMWKVFVCFVKLCQKRWSTAAYRAYVCQCVTKWQFLCCHFTLLLCLDKKWKSCSGANVNALNSPLISKHDCINNTSLLFKHPVMQQRKTFRPKSNFSYTIYVPVR